MRTLLFGAVLFVGCGGHVTGDGGDASNGISAGETGVGADSADTPAPGPGPGPAAGCPDDEPLSGQPCTDGPSGPFGHYYCHYYPPGATCPTEFKCTGAAGGDSPPYAFFAASTNCKVMPPDQCIEGADCKDVEQGASCVVECDRNCRCNATTNKLECSPIKC